MRAGQFPKLSQISQLSIVSCRQIGDGIHIRSDVRGRLIINVGKQTRGAGKRLIIADNRFNLHKQQRPKFHRQHSQGDLFPRISANGIFQIASARVYYGMSLCVLWMFSSFLNTMVSTPQTSTLLNNKPPVDRRKESPLHLRSHVNKWFSCYCCIFHD